MGADAETLWRRFSDVAAADASFCGDTPRPRTRRFCGDRFRPRRGIFAPLRYGGAGAFATVDIKKGELVEKGIVRVLTNCDGHENPYSPPRRNLLL